MCVCLNHFSAWVSHFKGPINWLFFRLVQGMSEWFIVLRYPCIPEAMQVANDDEWDDETYARQQEKLRSWWGCWSTTRCFPARYFQTIQMTQPKPCDTIYYGPAKVANSTYVRPITIDWVHDFWAMAILVMYVYTPRLMHDLWFPAVRSDCCDWWFPTASKKQVSGRSLQIRTLQRNPAKVFLMQKKMKTKKF